MLRSCIYIFLTSILFLRVSSDVRNSFITIPSNVFNDHVTYYFWGLLVLKLFNLNFGIFLKICFTKDEFSTKKDDFSDSKDDCSRVLLKTVLKLQLQNKKAAG